MSSVPATPPPSTDWVIELKITDVITIINNLKDYAYWPLQSSGEITRQFRLAQRAFRRTTHGNLLLSWKGVYKSRAPGRRDDQILYGDA